MKALPPRLRRALLLRSFAVQGSWNYRTLIGAGFAFVLAPVLRELHRGDPEGLRAAYARHAELFNSHPYLVGVAAGAVARLEAEGTPPETVRRFKDAVRGSLGAIGDRLVWLTWRPAAALAGVAAVLVGAPWWAGAAVLLLTHNALHLWLRAWGLTTGLEHGVRVAAAIRETPLAALADRAAAVGAVLAGAAAALAALRAAAGPAEAGIALAAVAAGALLGRRTRTAAIAALALVCAAALLA